MKKLCGLFILSMSLVCSAAYADVGGVFMVVKGDVKISSKSGKTESAKVGTKVAEGDSVQSGHDSRAKIVMADKNVFNISPDSRMTIEKYQNTGAAKNVELKVEFGKVRAAVEQKYDGDKSQFNVKTPTAVAGVRGTDFMTGYNPQTRVTDVVTFSGMVAVGKPSANGTMSNPVYVSPGHMTQVGDSNKAPDAPKAVPASDLKQMNQDTKADSSAKNSSGSTAATSTAAATSGTTSGSSSSTSNTTDGKSSDSSGRQPASVGTALPSPVGGSMVTPTDLGVEPVTRMPSSTPTSSSGAPPPSSPVLPTLPPTVPQQKPPPPTSSSKLNITITHPQ